MGQLLVGESSMVGKLLEIIDDMSDHGAAACAARALFEHGAWQAAPEALREHAVHVLARALGNPATLGRGGKGDLTGQDAGSGVQNKATRSSNIDSSKPAHAGTLCGR